MSIKPYEAPTNYKAISQARLFANEYDAATGYIDLRSDGERRRRNMKAIRTEWSPLVHHFVATYIEFDDGSVWTKKNGASPAKKPGTSGWIPWQPINPVPSRMGGKSITSDEAKGSFALNNNLGRHN